MPRRKPNVVRVETTKVQGEGSFVVFRKFTWEERRELREKMRAWLPEGTKGLPDAYIDGIEGLILSRLVEWNWADENEQPIPLPKTSDDLGALMDEEIQFLFETMQRLIRGALGQGDEAKN